MEKRGKFRSLVSSIHSINFILLSLIFLIFILPLVLAAVTQISFVGDTPANGTTQSTDSIIVSLSTTADTDHYAFVDFDNSLVGWWRFDNDSSVGENNTLVYDWSGNGNNGTILGNAFHNSSGMFNGSYSFDGLTGKINISSTNLNLTNQTIAAWIYFDTFSSNQRLFNSVDELPDGFGFITSTTGNRWTYKYYNSSGFTKTGVIGTNSLSSGRWIHLVFVYSVNGNTVNLTYYANGTVYGSVQNSDGFAPTPIKWIGTRGTPNTYMLNGSIDEFLIFNRSLSPIETLALYNASANQYYKNFTGLGEGTHTFRGHAIDTYGNMNQTGQRSVTIDFSLIPPIVNLISPSNSSSSVNDLQYFYANFTDETALVNSTFYLWNSTDSLINQTTTNINGTYNSTNLSVTLPYSDTFKWNYLATDSDNNVAFASSNFTFVYNSSSDVTPPNVTINFPVEGATYSTLPMNLTFNVTLSENGTVSYSLDSGINNISMSSTDNQNFIASNTSIADGAYTFSVYANDTSGNNNFSESVTFSVGTSFGNATAIEQYGITWYFNQSVTYGKFINGDYWILGPVTITNITPGYNGTMHGWEVNPTSGTQQGYDSRINGFNSSIVPSNNSYVANTGSSVIKALSNETGSDCAKDGHTTCYLVTAAVLTVLDTIPPNNGSTVFRPPYFGSDKTLYHNSSINVSFLPSLAIVNATATYNFSDIENDFRRVQLDHRNSWTGRYLHPSLNMLDYGAEIAQVNTMAFQRFLFNDTTNNQAFTNYVQAGLDYFGMVQGGISWNSDGGHMEGRLLPTLFAAFALDNQTMMDVIENKTANFSEYQHIWIGNNSNGTALWGKEGTESTYWNNIVNDALARDTKDPYGYIDGGLRPGDSYQYLQAGTFKNIGLVFVIVNSLGDVWDSTTIINYSKSQVENGAWTQPDVCAPADGLCVGGSNDGGYCNTAGENGTTGCDSGGLNGYCNSFCAGGGSCNYTANYATNYGVTYGPNATTETCILDTNASDGTGRFPLLHGNSNNTGQYFTELGNEIWDTYFEAYYALMGEESSSLTINFTSPTPANGSTQSNTDIYVNLSTNASGDHYAFVDFDNDLLLWMRMDDTNSSSDPIDLTGKNNGSLQGDALINSTGKFGNASWFDGNADYIMLGSNSQSLQIQTGFFISSWVYPISSTTSGIMKRGAITSSANNVQQFLLGYNADNSINFRIAAGDGASSNNIQTPAGTVPLNQWTHVLCGLNSSNYLECYIDGVLNASTQKTIIGHYSEDNTTMIGAIRTTSGYFNGSIDEVLVFNRSLTGSEIAALYNATESQYYHNFTNLADATYGFTGYAVDTLGNINQTSEQFINVAAGDINGPTINLNQFGLSSMDNIIDNPNVYLNGSFSDDIQLSNYTLYIWNATGDLINQTTNSITGATNSSNISFIIPYEGNFSWNYLVYDNSSNGAFASTNNSFEYNVPQVIARFDVVPYQTFNTPFEVGVVAFHKMGIFNVELNVTDQAGNSTFTNITNMSYNSRTEVWEYWTTLNASNFDDGQINVSAIVYPNTTSDRGKSRTLNITLNTNAGGSLPSLVRYVATNGSDSTGNGTIGNPFATILKAAKDIQDTQGLNADGGVIYLLAGNHSYGNYSFSLLTTTESRWLTIKPAPGLNKSDVFITSYTSTDGLRTKLVKVESVMIQSSTDITILQSNTALEDYLWIDNVDLIGYDKTVSDSWDGGWTSKYITNSYVTSSRDSMFADFVRNFTIYNIGSDAFTNPTFVVNSLVNTINRENSSFHPDVIQFQGTGTRENIIIYGLNAYNVTAQGIFTNGDDLLDINNLAIVNVLIDVTENSGLISQWRDVDSRNILFWHLTLSGQGFDFRNSTGGYSLGNLDVRNSVFNSLLTENFVLSNNSFFNNHFIITNVSSQVAGDNFTNGTAGFVNQSGFDFHPNSTSILRYRVPTNGNQVVPIDLEGNELPADGSAAIGALQYLVSGSSDSSPPTIELISPANASTVSSASNYFAANFTDDIQLSNSTFYLWNSTNSVVNTTTTTITGTNNETNLSVTIPYEGNFTWNYLVTDNSSNGAFAQSNFTLTYTVSAISGASPTINFTSPTPSNGSTQSTDSIIVNLSTTADTDHYAFVDFDNSLVGWWRFDNDSSAGENNTLVYDWSGNGNNGTISSSNSWLNSSGMFNGSFSSNGVDDNINGIDLPSVGSLNLTRQVSISAWINTASSSSSQAIFSRGGSVTSSSNSVQYTLYIASGTLRMWVGNGSSDGGLLVLSSSNSIQDNEWYYVTGTFNGSTVSVYINGILNNTNSKEGYSTLSTAEYDTSIGGDTRNNRVYFNGSIDEVLVFNQSLSAQEVAALYNASTNQYYNNFTNLQEGIHSFTGYAVDTSGNKNETETRTITIDATTPPDVSIISPSNDSTITSSSQYFLANFSDDTQLANSTFYLWNSSGSVVNQTTSTISGTTNSTNLSVTLPYEDVFQWNYQSCDSLNNCGFADSNYTLTYNGGADTTSPNVTINFPVEGATYSTLPMNLTFNVTLSENGTVRYSLDSGLNNVTMSSSDNQGFNATNSSIADGTYTFQVYANDSSGNNNFSESVTFIINTSYGNATAIEQYGITWYFNQTVTYGKFANGDYWILGPVTIINITPTYNGSLHGWEVNPNNTLQQGFDSRVSNFNASLVPNLPYNATGNQSIVKGYSNESSNPLCPDGHDCPLITAAVLTVLDFIPISNGSTLFRPAYFGNDKDFYYTTSLNTIVLPSLNETQNAVSLSTVESRFKRVQLDHKTDYTGRSLHPYLNLRDYGAEIASEYAENYLVLTLNYSLEEKWNVLVYGVQTGIDAYAVINDGEGWDANGGHSNGRKIPVTFASKLLNDSEMGAAVSGAADVQFSENSQVYVGVNDTPLFGNNATVLAYWDSIVNDAGSRTNKDPYDYIDGGLRPGDSYQSCCIAQSWKGHVLMLHLIEELRSVWNDTVIIDYTDRWVNNGTWTQPDVCAPADGLCVGGSNDGGYCNTAGENGTTGCDSGGLNGYCNSFCAGGGSCNYTANYATNYGVTYGHNSTSGSCILDTNSSDGTGRFVGRHLFNADGGGYGSTFVDEMWIAYRNTSTYSALMGGEESSGLTINFTSPTPANGSTQSNTDIYVNLSTNASGDHYAFVDFDNSLVGWWRFDNDSSVGENNTLVYDWSGNGNNGTICQYQSVGSPCIVPTSVFVNNTKFNGGFDLNFSTNYMNLGDFDSVENVTGLTISIWAKSNTPDATVTYTLANKVGAGIDSFSLYYSSNEYLYFAAYNSSGSSSTGYYSNALSDTDWHHIVGVYNGTNVMVYKDGVIGSHVESFVGEGLSENTHPLRVGLDGNGAAAFNGTLDELLIFNRSLSNQEILALYNASATQYQDNFTDLDEATHSIKGFAVDTLGNMNQTETRMVTIQGDLVYPIFSNYWDNNATIIDSGIGLFNVSVNNTNGTVFLEIDGTNYTATNYSANVYNLSVTLTGGTYSYYWGAYGNGTSSNYNISGTRFYTVNSSGIDSTNPTLNLTSPSNNTYTNSTTIYFLANFTDNFQLSNSTFYLWNSSSDLINQTTTVITGTSNSTNLSVIIPYDGAFTWNYLAVDNSSNRAFDSSNLTVTVDTISPIVNLVYPTNNTETTSRNILFTYNVTETNSVVNCSLILNDMLNSTDTSITQDINQSFNKTLLIGGYNWSIQCTDISNNMGTSSLNNLSVISNGCDIYVNASSSETACLSSSPCNLSYAKSIVSPGEGVCLMPGNYGNFSIDEGFGTSESWVTYKADPDTISQRNTSWYQSDLERPNANENVIFNGITFENNGAGGISNGHYVILDGLNVVGGYVDFDAYSAEIIVRNLSVFGTWSEYSSDVTSTAFNIYHYDANFNDSDYRNILIEDSYSENTSSGANIYGKFDNITFRHNHFQKFEGSGISVTRDSGVVYLEDNHINYQSPLADTLKVTSYFASISENLRNITLNETISNTWDLVELINPNTNETYLAHMENENTVNVTVVVLTEALPFTPDVGSTIRFWDASHGSCISIRSNHSLYATGNIIHDCGTSQGFGIYTQEVVENFTIANNLIYSTINQYSFKFNSLDSGGFGNNTVIENNTIVGLRPLSFSNAKSTYGIAFVPLFNNTAAIVRNNIFVGIAYDDADVNMSAIEIQNNLIYADYVGDVYENDSIGQNQNNTIYFQGESLGNQPYTFDNSGVFFTGGIDFETYAFYQNHYNQNNFFKPVIGSEACSNGIIMHGHLIGQSCASSPTVILLSPSNNSNVTNATQSFNATLGNPTPLANVTYYLWNSSGNLINSTFEIVTGTSNSTNVSMILPYGDIFVWNFLAVDNSSNSSFAPSNFTINYSVESESEESNSSEDNSGSSPSSGGGGGGGGAVTSSFWKNTYSFDQQGVEQLQKIEKELSSQQRIRIKLNGEEHHVGVTNVTNTSAIVNVSSKSTQKTIFVGQSEKFEVDEDEYYDLLVTLIGINNSKANLTISYLHEKVPINEIEETPVEQEETGNDQIEEENGQEQILEEGGEEIPLRNILIGFISFAFLVGVVTIILVLTHKKKFKNKSRH